MKTKTRGFTLMEVIIVVAIIAILASAVLIALNPAKNLRDARNATRWSQMNAIANGIYSYIIANQGVYPTCMFDEELEDPIENPYGRILYDEDSEDSWDLISITDCTDQLSPTYLPSTPREPQSQDYVIGFVDATSSDRLIIRCTAPEANDLETGTIIVIQ